MPSPGTIEITKPDTRSEESLAPPWHVIIYNDPVNLMMYVTMVIMRVFGYPKDKAHRMMLDVHTRGRCIVWTGERERAECFVEQLQAYQLLAGMTEAS